MQATSTLNPVHKSSIKTKPAALQRFVTICLLLAMIPTAFVYVVRVHSLVKRGALTTTTGFEGPMIYGVWKAAHHFPIYESVTQPLFSNTLYNYLFYISYGFLISGMSGDDPRALLLSRLTTCLFVAVGTVICFCLIRLIIGNTTPVTNLQAVLAGAIFWFSSSPVGWFGLSVRPDMAAVAMASLGLLCLWLYLKNLNEAMVVCSSLAFFFAWSFKQSVVTTFVGTAFIHYVLIRRWRPLLLHLVPFAICVAATLCLGGADYRFNTLAVPALGVFAPLLAWTFPVKAIIENPLLYATIPIAFFCLASTKCLNERVFRAFNISSQNDQIVAFSILFAATFSGGIALCLRAGSDRNYFFEAGMAGAVGLLPSLRVLFHHWPRFANAWLLLGVCLVAAVCSVQVFSYGAQEFQGSGTVSNLPLIGNSEFGRLGLLSEHDWEQRFELVRSMSALPQPILITDEVLGQPFYSTGGHFPALVQDPNITSDLLKHGLLRTDPATAAIRQHLFPTLLLHDRSQCVLAAQEGYVASGRVDDMFQAFSLSR